VFLEKLTRVQLPKKRRLSYGNRCSLLYHGSLLLDLIFSKINLCYIFTPYFFRIHFNIIFLSSPLSPKWVSSLHIFQLILCMNFRLSHACNMSSTFLPSWFNHLYKIWWIVELHMKINITSFLSLRLFSVCSLHYFLHKHHQVLFLH
jgi:hypothetical protein